MKKYTYKSSKLIWAVTYFLFFALCHPWGLTGCKKAENTPERAFKNFSKWAKMGLTDGMEKYAEKEYISQLQRSYDSLALFSEMWPKDIIVVKSTIDNNQASVDVEGKNIVGKSVLGNFLLKKTGEQWLVYQGDWQFPIEN